MKGWKEHANPQNNYQVNSHKIIGGIKAGETIFPVDIIPFFYFACYFQSVWFTLLLYIDGFLFGVHVFISLFVSVYFIICFYLPFDSLLTFNSKL